MSVRSNESRAFWWILAGAAVLRGVLLLGYPFWDEARTLWAAVHFIRDRTLIPVDTTWPPLFSYLFAAAAVPSAALMSWTGPISEPAQLPALYSLHSPLALLPGRLLSLGFGLAAIAAAMRTASKHGGPWAGPLAGAALALSPMHTAYSALALADVASAYCVLGAVAAALDAASSRSEPALIRAGTWAGFAVAFKYNCVAVTAPLMTAGFLLPRGKGRSGPAHWLNKGSAACLLAFAASAAFGAIGWVLAPAKFVEGVRHQLEATTSLGHSVFWAPPLWGVLSSLWSSEGGIALLMMAGLGAALRRRNENDRVILSMILFGIVHIGSLKYQAGHYALFLLPAASVLFGLAGSRWMSALANGHPGVRAWALVVTLFCWPLYSSLKAATMALRPDSRWLAHDWLQREIPSGTPVVVDFAYLPRIITPDELARWLSGLHGEFYSRHLSLERTYPVLPIRYDMEWLRTVDAGYLLLSDRCYSRFLDHEGPPKGHPRRGKFEGGRAVYSALLTSPEGIGWRHVATFASGNGPAVDVFRRIGAGPRESAALP